MSASIHDIAAARSRRDGKRQPDGGLVTPQDRLVAQVREHLGAARRWKIDKRSPAERHDLIQLARNLHTLLERVPHGDKKKALARAGFADGTADAAASYAHNLTLPPEMSDPPTNRWRRLSPNINAYVAVAEACPPGGDAAVAQLFRGTLWEARCRSVTTRSAWMPELANLIRRLADTVAERTALGRLFDDMSAANLCLRNHGSHEMAATGWLSVTFHKTDVAGSAGEMSEPYWLLDREDEGAPLGGAALFSPKVALDVRTVEISLPRLICQQPEPNDLGEARLSIECTLYLALLPLASNLDQPASVEPTILLRPTMWLESPGTKIAIDFASPKGGSLHLARQDAVTGELFTYEADVDFNAWRAMLAESPHLSLDGDDAIDLAIGAWRAFPLESEACEAMLATPDSRLQFTTPPPPSVLRERLELYPGDMDEIDLAAIVPHRFAPQHSLAASIQRALGPSGPIAEALERDAIAYRCAFRDVVETATALLRDLEPGQGG